MRYWPGEHLNRWTGNRTEALRAAFAAEYAEAYEPCAGRVRLRFGYGLELGPLRSVRHLRALEVNVLAEPVPVGESVTGEPMFLSLDQVNILLSGVPGAGKSATLNLIIAWAALDLWCHLYLIDGKSELGRWSSVATARVESVEEACELLARVEAERKHRQFERGGRGVLAWRPGEVPLILVCVDELALYTDMTGLSGAEKSARQEFCGLLVQLARLGRADRVCLVCSTQRPSLDTVPGSYRELVSVRLALRCSTRDQSEIALGAGAFASGLDATTLPPTPGSLIVRGHQATAQRGRAYWLSDEDCRTVLRAATAARHLPGMASQGPAETL